MVEALLGDTDFYWVRGVDGWFVDEWIGGEASAAFGLQWRLGMLGFTWIGGVCIGWRLDWVILTFTGSREWINGLVNGLMRRRPARVAAPQARLCLWSDLV